MVLGRPLRAGAVGEMARRISDLGGNIHSIVRLTHRPVTALELVVSGVDAARLAGGSCTGRPRPGWTWRWSGPACSGGPSGCCCSTWTRC